MNYLKVLFVVMACIKANVADAQDLSVHTWNNRLVLILIDDESNDTYREQLKELKKESVGLKERKILVYHIKRDGFKKGLNTSDWQEETTKHDDLKKTDAPFEIVLIGLDGGIKLQQSTFLNSETLFSKIDSMPMRLNEIRNK